MMAVAEDGDQGLREELATMQLRRELEEAQSQLMSSRNAMQEQVDSWAAEMITEAQTVITTIDSPETGL